MSQFNISWQRIPSLLSTIRISDILDILVVAYLIYKLIMLIRRTNSFHLARGVLLILVALGLSGVKTVVSLPGISAFVGSDIVAGMEYTGLPEKGTHRLLLDLGTNAEIALFSEKGILCTAAAAGPCFEGANISCGMSASPGAVCAVTMDGVCTVIGGGEAKGLCATGLIDAITMGVRQELIDETGYIEDESMEICPGVTLTQKDIREFQLAKSAIRAGMECLIRKAGISFADISHLFVAGGFSSGLNV